MKVDLESRLKWFAHGESDLRSVLMDGSVDLRVPSRLPGWTRAHVIAHLIGNARALTNLVAWARTGEPTPMYANPDERLAQIEKDSAADDEWLLSACLTASDTLSHAVGGLQWPHWNSFVRTAQGREVPATEIPWLRVRETTLHLIDVDQGPALAQRDPGLIDALLDDVTPTLTTRPGCPSLLITPDDRHTRWKVGPESDAPRAIAGPADQILLWLTGRRPEPPPNAHRQADGLFELPRWL